MTAWPGLSAPRFSHAVLCNDGELHRVSVRIRRQRCNRPGCRLCKTIGGHGRFAYAVYRDGGGKVRTDYMGKVLSFHFAGGEIVKIDSIQCPTPGCPEQLPVKLSKYGKPTVFCRQCGFQGMVRYQRGVEMWLGKEGAKETPAPPKKDPPPVPRKEDPPPAPPKPKEDPDAWFKS